MNSLPLSVLQRLYTPGVVTDPLWMTPDTAWSTHIPFAFWLIQNQAPGTMVELGVHSGVSYCAFCQAIRTHGLSTAPYGVDTWEGDAHAGSYGERILEELRAHHDPLYASFSHLVRAPFDAAATHFSPGSVDLLHIDGLHTHGAVLHDFETWLPKLSRRGVILFHDVQVRERDFGVWQLWEELRQRYPSHTFPFGHGLGVLGIGPEQPDNLRWLLEGSEREAVNRFFGLWGERLESRSGMARALRERLEAQRSVAPLRLQQEQLQRQLRDLTRQLAASQTALEAALGELRPQLSACQDELHRCRAELMKARADHAAVVNSTTWRGTAPLRKAVELTRVLTHRQTLPGSLAGNDEPSGDPAATTGRPDPAATPTDLVPAVAKAEHDVCGAAPEPAPPFDPGRLNQPYPLRERWLDRNTPEVSLILLNLDRPDLTLACLDAIWQHTSGHSYEVVVVDNGSTPENFLRLATHLNTCTTLRLSINRFFGEGNNLGFESSRGRYVVFLNNDTRVTSGWLEPLIAPLIQQPLVGATGPRLLYPDGRLQEAGAEIRADGTSLQYGKQSNARDPAHNQPRTVPYISAAALALRHCDFAALLGFDLRYEPAYYEDSDLCFRLRQHGMSVLYCPQSTVIHEENATTRTLMESMHFTHLVDLNRQRFLGRWATTLENGPDSPPLPARPPLAPLNPLPAPNPDRPAVVLFTPYELIPGGGERYLLTVAAGLSHHANVTLCTPHPYSRLRLLTLGRELSLDLGQVALLRLSEAQRQHPFDHAIVLGNHLFPPVPGLARHNVYICQFPFPVTPEAAAQRWQFADDYDQVVVYSQFVRHHFLHRCQQSGRTYPQIQVISPSAALVTPPGGNIRKPWVLGVGRFFKDSHAKRQDLMIEAFVELLKHHPQAQLHLAGSLHAAPVYRDYYDELQVMARDLPVFFHINASPETLEQLYRQSSIYWHLSGYGIDDRSEPERCEHFGITPIEAMSAGCIPLAVNRGGPAETLRNCENGYLIETLEDLVQHSVDLLGRAPDDPLLERLRAAAIRTSQHYTAERLTEAFRHLLGL